MALHRRPRRRHQPRSSASPSSCWRTGSASAAPRWSPKAPAAPRSPVPRFSNPSASIPARTEERWSRSPVESVMTSTSPVYRIISHPITKVNFTEIIPPKRYFICPEISSGGPGVENPRFLPVNCPARSGWRAPRPRRQSDAPVGSIARHIARPQFLGLIARNPRNRPSITVRCSRQPGPCGSDTSEAPGAKARS